MSKEQLERVVQQNQALLDQMWASSEENLNTLNQLVGIARPGVITDILRLVLFQTDHNINKRRLENMS